MTYSEKLKDPRWQKKRLEVMHRDGFACLDCGATDKPLNVHHTHYHKGGPWETGVEHLRTVCADCHEKRHPLERELRREFDGVIAQLSPDQIELLISDIRSVAAQDAEMADLGITGGSSWSNGATIKTAIDYDYDADGRWYQQTTDPDCTARVAYVVNTGRDPWGILKSRDVS